jgi:hypothetical protein
MNRLRDFRDGEGKVDDPVFLRGVALLRRTQPTQPCAESVKRRVWWAMGRAGRSPSPLTRHLRLAVLAIVALAAGTAGAVIARGWIVPRPEARVRLPPPASPASRAARGRVEAPVARAEPTVEGPAPKPPKPQSLGAQRKPVVSTPAAVARERSEVLDALIALRRAHDPVRAGTLLARYLAAHPRGALREEALVLAIEAADARGDRAAGTQVARAYLGEFPGGRFAVFARGHDDAGH